MVACAVTTDTDPAVVTMCGNEGAAKKQKPQPRGRPGLSWLFAACTPNPLRGASLLGPNAERESIGYAQGGTREGIGLALQLL